MENGKKSSLKILEVIDNYYPVVDGVVNVVDAYARNLNKKADCFVLAPKYKNSPEPNGYELFRCASLSGGKFNVRLPLPSLDPKLRKFLKKHSFDIIHCHSPVTCGRYMAKYAKKHDIPVVFTVHTKYHEEINAHLKSKLLRKIALGFLVSTMKKMDCFWAVSEGAKEVLSDTYGIKNDCLVVHNGSGLTPELVAAADGGTIRKKYGVAEDDFVLLSVGRLVKVKHFDILIDAVQILREKNLKVKLFIVGDGEYKSTLKEEAEERKEDRDVIFTGKVDPKDMALFYAAANLYVMPSTFDTSSLAVKDAYAASLPVLAVKNSPAAEGITDGKNSYLAEDSAESFAEKIASIIAAPDNLAAVKDACSKELYSSWDEITDRVLSEYEKIVNKA